MLLRNSVDPLLSGLLRDSYPLAALDGDGPGVQDAGGGDRDMSNLQRDFRQVRAGTPFG